MESLSTRWQQITQTFRWQGISGLLFKLLGLLGYRRAFILEKVLHGPTVSKPLWQGEIRRLKPEEEDLYLAFRNRDRAARIPPERVKRIFKEGHHCFGAFLDGRIVAASWVAEKDCWSNRLQQSITVGPGEIYIFDSYCLPEFRGQGIIPAVGEKITCCFFEKGYRYSLRAVEPENKSSLRACFKLGCRARALVGTVKLGPWKWTFSRSTWRGRRLHEQNAAFFVE